MTFDEIKSLLAQALTVNPRFDHPVFRDHLSSIAGETQIRQQVIEGQTFTTLFLTHNTIPSAYRRDPQFCFSGEARYFKSLTLDQEMRVLSIGVPHFFNLENFQDLDQFAEWQQSFRYIEKHDGTCLLITVEPKRFIIRSRRQIYAICEELSCLDFPDYDFGTRLMALSEELRRRGTCTIFTEAIFPHPALHKVSLSPFYKRIMQGSGFCPYVDYPAQNIFFNGILWHDPIMRLEPQSTTSQICQEHGLRRPKELLFKSYAEVELWLKKQQNIEGLCVYFRDDQSILKFKTRWYRRVRNTTGEIFALLKPPGMRFDNLSSDAAKAKLTKAG